ncbi:putative GIY-YIG superfamily endonuclease [Rhizobium ruizarguesonis]
MAARLKREAATTQAGNLIPRGKHHGSALILRCGGQRPEPRRTGAGGPAPTSAPALLDDTPAASPVLRGPAGHLRMRLEIGRARRIAASSSAWDALSLDQPTNHTAPRSALILRCGGQRPKPRRTRAGGRHLQHYCRPPTHHASLPPWKSPPILRCADGSYYTGLTKQEIEARVWEHNAGTYDGYTAKRRPVELVFTETYDRIIDAIARERQIKGWSRRKKEALMAMYYEALLDLSKRGPVKAG